MKTHEQKMHEKAEHEAELERNDLYAWGQKTWSGLKATSTKDLITSRFFVGAVSLGAIVGLLYYIFGGTSADVAGWKALDTATTVESYDDVAKAKPDGLPSKAAKLQKARTLLGPRGVLQMDNNRDPQVRTNAIKSIEEARETFNKLIDEFKGDLTLQCLAMEGAAQAELALVGIPKEGTSTASQDFRGSVEKAIELYRRYEKTAGPTAGEPAKKIADELEARKSDVLKLGEYINERLSPSRPQPKIEVPPSLTPSPGGPTPAPK